MAVAVPMLGRANIPRMEPDPLTSSVEAGVAVLMHRDQGTAWLFGLSQHLHAEPAGFTCNKQIRRKSVALGSAEGHRVLPILARGDVLSLHP